MIRITVTSIASLLVFAPGCAGDDGGGGTHHSLAFAGSEYTPHAGQNLKIQVIDTADRSVVQSDMVMVSGATVSFTWPGILEDGHGYEVRWYVDANANGICNHPPEDHSWVSTLAEVISDQTVTHTHDTNVTPVCDTFGEFALTFTGSDFAPHNGNMLYAAILATDDTVVARGTTTVEGGAFSLDWPALLVGGQSYKVRFYADVNGNNACDAPPTDHVWEATIGTVTAAKTFDYPHDTNVTDVCSTFP